MECDFWLREWTYFISECNNNFPNQLTFPSIIYKNSSYSITSPIDGIDSLFKFCTFWWMCNATSLWFYITFSSWEMMSRPFHVTIVGYFNILFWEVPAQIFCQFFNWTICLYLIGYKSSLYIASYFLVIGMVKNFLSDCDLFIHIFNDIYLVNRKSEF